MPITILNNIYTSIDLVDRARYQIINIILDKNGMSNGW